MRIPNLIGLNTFWNPFIRSLDESDSIIESNFSDWQVVISRDKQVLEVKRLSTDMPNTRLKPVYSGTGDLSIVLLAESRKAAENRGQRIASRIASAGLWGLDFLDLVDLEFDK